MSGRSRVLAVLVAALSAVGLWSVADAAQALATPCGASGAYSVSGATATCTYTSQGTEDTFTVPSYANSLSVTAVGAPGAPGYPAGSSSGGLGASVVNTALPVPRGGLAAVRGRRWDWPLCRNGAGGGGV